MLKAYLLAGAGLCCLATAAQAQNCFAHGFGVVDNGIGTLTVRSGRICGLGRESGSLMAIRGNRIISQPRFGRAGVTTRAIVYMARAGYVGPDGFAFQTVGRNRWGQPVVQTVQVQVNVTP